MVEIGLNRWDWRSPESFGRAVAEGEALGIDWAFLPVNPLGVTDPYVLMATAAQATSTIGLGPLLDTPALRPPAMAAGSIATVDMLAPGRTMLTYGVGDTAVRWLGKRPSTIAELEAATAEARSYLAGERIEVGADQPAFLRHPRRVPVWIAASGPRSLRAAGRSADGVFMRIGTHPDNIRVALEQVRAGAVDVGRDPDAVDLGVIVHTCTSRDPAEVRAITRAMAAGFYEYAPALFDPPGFEWNGTPIEELKAQLWPDFHHASDLVAAGQLVDFLDDEVAASFSFHGTAEDVAAQARRILDAVPEIRIVVPHPVPMPGRDELSGYMRWLGEELKPLL